VESGDELVSIIIPVFNKCEYTRPCIRSLYENTSYPHFEVIAVNNNSTDETPSFRVWAQGEYGIRVIRNERNLGFAKTCNQGAGVARGSLLFFLNNDTIARPGWLDALVEVLTGERRVGIVGSKLLYPDGTFSMPVW
jgi:GT2 family glycosyltransferase